MKKYAIHIFTIACTLLALVVSTFAWMLGNQETQLVKTFGLFYGEDEDNTLTVVSQDLSFEVLVQNAEGEYEPFHDYVFDEAIPGEIIPFEIRFYNSANRVVTIDLSISGIDSKKEGEPFEENGQTLIHHTFVSLMGDGDIYQGVAPVEEYKCLGDGLEGLPSEGGHSLVVAANMQIPKQEEAETPYVLHCYFLVDGSVDSGFQDVTLEIGTFVASIH